MSASSVPLRMPFRINQELRNKLRFYAGFAQHRTSLKQLVEFGSEPNQFVLLRSAQFLREELPIRLARRAIELESLPQGLSNVDEIKRVAGWYGLSFEELASLPDRRHYDPLQYIPLQSTPNGKPISESNAFQSALHNVPPKVVEINRHFVEVIEKIKRRHDPVVMQIAQGMLNFKENLGTTAMSPEIHVFLDRFYTSRIGIRLLIGQHIALVNHHGRSDWVGIICTRTNIREIANEAIANARSICQQYYGLMDSPSVDLICNPELTFTYIPSHLHHIVFEVIKNSLRATVEFHGVESSRFPSVKIIVAEGDEDVTVKVSDEGGGIKRSLIDKVWAYSFSTANPPPLEHDEMRGDFSAPLAGYGYGLPISRLYARYFGGDLRLISMEHYGTDAYIHLCRLSDSNEPIS